MRKLLLAVGAIVALAAPTAAQANLTASPASTIAPGYPDFLQAPNGQQAAVCTSDLAGSNCPGSPSAAALVDPGPGGDAEAFYWSGAATTSLGGRDIGIAFDVEVATVGGDADLGTGPTQGSFQRIQMSGDLGLPAGTYTFVTPFGTFTVNPADAKARNNWKRIETTVATDGPIDHFLTQVGAPVGFYGNGAGPQAVTDGATVFVYKPGHSPADVDAFGVPIPADATTSDWDIIGAQAGNPVNLPPADADGDGVPDSSDNCPTVAAATASGCPNPTLPSTTPSTSDNGTVDQGPGDRPATPGTIVQQIPGPTQVIQVQPSARRPVNRTTFQGRVVSVNRTRKTFRLRVQRSRVVTIKATSRTRYEHLRGFRSIRTGLRLEAVTRRVNGVNVATLIETSGRNR